MKLIWHWLILSAAVYATTYVVHGISIAPWWSIFIVGACLMFINTIIKPVLGILTLPINILTLGIFSLILNALLFWALTFIISGFIIQTFTAAFLGSLIISVLNWIGGKVFA